ncbi:MAG: DegT/DnrJ/EryC1/StrS family aminotransferase [candidate division Zixibacteria bacterium]|nr:DegT/DnrJ/EryC1/StrS family aminotransferase [candidate division Zixibacteria bacterium]MDH3936812.1 DegT/DnrJ/EryC1/StrS family aminotransferase [candidate division Zixibacteria bacterium]
MEIKYLDLQANYQSIKPEIDEAIRKVLDSSAYVLGPAVQEFESAYADYCGTKFAIGCNSGTTALTLALRALEVGPGDEVITAANTFIATAAAIVHAGARPVLVDIDPETRNLDPTLLKMAITSRTRAIIPVHLYGCPADMDAITQLAANHDIPVLEDAAQAHGARYKDRPAGSMGRLAAFSFYPGKNLGAYGEAGAVTTDDPELDRKVRMLRDHGSNKKYVHELLGYNARMEGIQGAVLKVKLSHLDHWNSERNRVALLYNRLLAAVPIKLPRFDDDLRQVFHLYVIETEQRDQMQKHLSESGVPSLIHYPIPIHMQKAFDYLDCREGDFPITEKMAGEILSLPIYPEMTDEQVTYVADQVKAFFG